MQGVDQMSRMQPKLVDKAIGVVILTTRDQRLVYEAAAIVKAGWWCTGVVIAGEETMW